MGVRCLAVVAGKEQAVIVGMPSVIMIVYTAAALHLLTHALVIADGQAQPVTWILMNVLSIMATVNKCAQTLMVDTCVAATEDTIQSLKVTAMISMNVDVTSICVSARAMISVKAVMQRVLIHMEVTGAHVLVDSSFWVQIFVQTKTNVHTTMVGVIKNVITLQGPITAAAGVAIS